MSHHVIDLSHLDLKKLLEMEEFAPLFWKRPVSGTYHNDTPAGSGSILELRVDVDGRRPQDRLSGDLYTHFTFCGMPITFFTGSFVVQEVAEERDSSSITLSGPVIYYSDAGNTADTITVRIPRVNYYASPAAACVDWFTNGTLVRSYVCPKTSSCFSFSPIRFEPSASSSPNPSR